MTNVDFGKTPVLTIVLLLALAARLPAQAPPRPAPATPPKPAPATPPKPVAGTEKSRTQKLEKSGRITEGKVPVLDFLRFIQASTGKVVVYPSAQPDQFFDERAMIDVLGDVENLTYPMARTILESNGYEFSEEMLHDGSKVINVRHARSNIPSPTRKEEILKPGEKILPGREQEVADLVLQLKYADTQTVIAALRDLLGVTSRGNTNASVQVVQVNTTNTLIIQAKRDILQYIRELVKYIDVEVKGPEPIMKVVRVYNADAQDVVSIISEVLNIQTTGIGSRGLRSPQTRGVPGQPQIPGRGPNDQDFTNLIADDRTQKIIIETTSQSDYELILGLVDELDAKEDLFRPTSHVYKVKYLKASDLADIVRQLVEGAAPTGGLSNRRTTTPTRTRSITPTQPGQSAQQIPTRIVAHDATNSILIQAETPEYRQIENILEGIDIKRRQVFLEAALVQVTEGSTLNYALEWLAGNLDDRATRAAFMSAFGLSTVDPSQLPTNFTRVISPQAPTTGVIGAVSRQGQLPLLIRALKTDTNASVLATPFILADDNEQSTISSTNTIFFTTTTSTNTGTSTGQGSSDAGINLTLTPTISENNVLLDLQLQVSSFGSTSSGSGSVPDRSENNINSRISIADGELFIIGGLVREIEAQSVDKVPFLGDIPLIGYFFQARNSTVQRNNLYVFLTAHILSNDFNGLRQLTDEGLKGMRKSSPNVKVQNFTNPKKDNKASGQDNGVKKDFEKPGGGK